MFYHLCSLRYFSSSNHSSLTLSPSLSLSLFLSLSLSLSLSLPLSVVFYLCLLFFFRERKSFRFHPIWRTLKKTKMSIRNRKNRMMFINILTAVRTRMRTYLNPRLKKLVIEVLTSYYVTICYVVLLYIISYYILLDYIM